MAARRSPRPLLRVRLSALPAGKAKPYDVAAVRKQSSVFKWAFTELEVVVPVRQCLLWSLARTHARLAALLLAVVCELYDFLDVLIGTANGWENIAVM